MSKLQTEFKETQLPIILEKYQKLDPRRLKRLKTIALEFADYYFGFMEQKIAIGHDVKSYILLQPKWEASAFHFLNRLRMDKGFKQEFDLDKLGKLAFIASDDQVLNLDVLKPHEILDDPKKDTLAEEVLGSLIKKSIMAVYTVFKKDKRPESLILTSNALPLRTDSAIQTR